MGIFTSATRSPRVASLEASKQIQKDAVRRHRGPRTRHAKGDIGDTIIVAAPNLRTLECKKKSKLILTSVCIPPSPSPSSSPSPRKRKAAALDDDDIFTAGAGNPTKRSSMSRSGSPNPEDTENLTPPVTPREIIEDLDLDEQLQHQNKHPQTVDTLSTWLEPNVVWIDLVDENTCVDSLKTATGAETKEHPELAPPRDGTASRLVCLCLGRHGEKLRNFPSQRFEASKKAREANDVATSRDRQEQRLGDHRSEHDDHCDDLAETARDLNTASDEKSATGSVTQLPRLITNTSASTTPATSPQKRSITSPYTDLNVSSLSLQSTAVNLAPPVDVAVAASGELREEADQDINLEHVRDSEAAQAALPEIHNNDGEQMCEDSPGEEPDDGGGGDPMEGVILPSHGGEPTKASIPPSNEDSNTTSKTRHRDNITVRNSPRAVSPSEGADTGDNAMEEYPTDAVSATSTSSPASSIKCDENRDDGLAEESETEPENPPPLRRSASPILGDIGEWDGDGDRPMAQGDTGTHLEEPHTAVPPSIPGTPSTAHAPSDEGGGDDDTSSESTPSSAREESVSLTPKPCESAHTDNQQVIIVIDSDSEKEPPTPALPFPQPQNQTQAMPPPPPPPPRVVTSMPPPPLPRAYRYRVIKPRPIAPAPLSANQQRSGLGYGHGGRATGSGGVRGTGVRAGVGVEKRRERISIGELLNGG